MTSNIRDTGRRGGSITSAGLRQYQVLLAVLSQPCTLMSLLDCICCPRHGHLTAVAWDDLQSPSFLTYSYLVENSCRFACYLRHRVTRFFSGWTVGLYGSNCPEMLCALLGILAVPAAYVPVDLSQPAAMKEHTLKNLGVRCVVVHSPWLEVCTSSNL